MERTYTIPLRKAFLKTPKYLRTNRAAREVRMYLQRHTKTQKIKIGEELNKALWARGDSKPPARVTVFAKKEDDVVYAELAGKDFQKKDFSAKDEEKPKKETRGLASKATEEPAAEAKPAKAEKKEEPKKEAKTKPAAKKTSKK